MSTRLSMDVKLGTLSDFLNIKHIFKEKIIIKEHASKKISNRGIKKENIFDCLINKNLKGILEQDLNKFKLYYKNPQPPKNMISLSLLPSKTI